MPKLDIIIPHWKEDEWLMKPMYEILSLQRNIKFTDFRVLMVLDGMDIELSDEFRAYAKSMPFETKCLPKEHEGISAARNYGLDHSDAEWVMFCDSDDAFLCTTSLQTYFRHMNPDKAFVSSAFFEEAPSRLDGHMMLLWHSGKDFIFIHGKAFNRKWLKSNNIRFNNDIKLHEDTYFVAIAKYSVSKQDSVYIKDPLYLWQYNKKSVTRSYENFVLSTYDQLMKKNAALTDELLRRGMFVPAKGIVCRTITDAYCRLHCLSWNKPGNEELIADAEDCVALFLHKYDYIFKSAGDVVINAGLNQLRDELIRVNNFDEANTISFEDWVAQLRY